MTAIHHMTHERPLVVATDGRRQSDGALAIARALAANARALHVISVVPPLPSTPETLVVTSPDIVAARGARARRAVIEQMERVWSDASDVEIAEGDPATVVARHARDTGARMIVCGLGRHTVADRVFGAVTALRLIRMASVPVLAATADLAHAPRRVVAAIDFTESSIRAARTAVELAAPDARLYLVHVASRSLNEPHFVNDDAEFRLSLARVHGGIGVPSTAAAEHVVLRGDPAAELLDFAASVGADLIATGTHGRGLLARMFVGSVAAAVVRASVCSVLCVPCAGAPAP